MNVLKDLLRFEPEYAMSGVEFKLGGGGRFNGSGTVMGAPYEGII